MEIQMARQMDEAMARLMEPLTVLSRESPMGIRMGLAMTVLLMERRMD